MHTQAGLAGFVTAVRDKGAQGAIIDCVAPSMSAGNLASTWKIPIVSFAGASPDLSDKERYNTLACIFPALTSSGNALLALLVRYNWTNVGMMVEKSDSSFLHLEYIRQGITQVLKANNISFISATISPTMDVSDIRSALHILSNASRGILISLQIALLINILL